MVGGSLPGPPPSHPGSLSPGPGASHLCSPRLGSTLPAGPQPSPPRGAAAQPGLALWPLDPESPAGWPTSGGVPTFCPGRQPPPPGGSCTAGAMWLCASPKDAHPHPSWPQGFMVYHRPWLAALPASTSSRALSLAPGVFPTRRRSMGLPVCPTLATSGTFPVTPPPPSAVRIAEHVTWPSPASVSTVPPAPPPPQGKLGSCQGVQ